MRTETRIHENTIQTPKIPSLKAAQTKTISPLKWKQTPAAVESRRWDFGHIPSERSLEAVGKSVRLHRIGRSKVFDLFPRTEKDKNQCDSG